ncbi:DUF5906 domain-containing protein [Paracoccus sp. KR1-242]|uniref:DUF5906 domain-containing protein n=1 Tax=Paracoccus sp. KR1-242 TaxID=3410028 RepID=UPI003C0FA477
MESENHLNMFIRLFAGNPKTYYRADPTLVTRSSDGKVEARYLCIGGKLPDEYFREHLEGGLGLSIVLNKPGPDGALDHVTRAAVDIDDYSVDPADVAAKLDAAKVPHVLTLSKSGGVHVHLFFADLIPAKLAQGLGAQVKALLGLDPKKVEVFPKQAIVEESDSGSGLNLCYHGANRRGWSPEGPLALGDFLQRCEAAHISRDQLASLMGALPNPPKPQARFVPLAEMAPNKEDAPFYGGPPCMQKLVAEGPVGDHRNNFLYNVAVFEKKAGADGFDEIHAALITANARWCSPPLDPKEVKGVAKSVAKTAGAHFKCNDEPICGLCNKDRCKSRPYGIGGGGGIPFYDEIVEKVSGHYHVVSLGGKPVVMSSELVPSQFHTRRAWVVQTYGDFRGTLINRSVKIPTKDGYRVQKLADTYLTDPERPTYAGVVLDDRNRWPDFLNLWQGFAVEPAPGDWSLFKEHLRKVICAGNKGLYDYVLGWMAWKVQNPCAVPGVALVLRGGRGTGKNTFAEGYGKIFGQHLYITAHSDQVMGRFNAHLMDCCLLIADEAFWAGDKRHEGALKSMITGEQIGFEGKGLKAVQADNHIGMVVLSNNDYVVPAGLDERRFCVLDVSEEHKQDSTYFAALRAQMDAGGREALLHDLQQMDLTGFDIRKVPQTKGLIYQKLESAEPFLKWMIEALTVGKITFPHKTQAGMDSENWTRGAKFSVEKDEFFAAYHEWCKNNTRKGSVASIQKIGRDVGKYLFGGDKVKQHREGRNGPWSYDLPSLEESRHMIEKAFGGEIDWGEDNVIELPEKKPSGGVSEQDRRGYMGDDYDDLEFIEPRKH